MSEMFHINYVPNLIKDYKSNYIPGKIINIKYRKDYKLDIINLFSLILLKENGLKEYYKNFDNTMSIERKLAPEEIDNFKVKLQTTKFNI